MTWFVPIGKKSIYDIMKSIICVARKCRQSTLSISLEIEYGVGGLISKLDQVYVGLSAGSIVDFSLFPHLNHKREVCIVTIFIFK